MIPRRFKQLKKDLFLAYGDEGHVDIKNLSSYLQSLDEDSLAIICAGIKAKLEEYLQSSESFTSDDVKKLASLDAAIKSEYILNRNGKLGYILAGIYWPILRDKIKAEYEKETNPSLYNPRK